MNAAEIEARFDHAASTGAPAAELDGLLARLREARSEESARLLDDVRAFITRFCAFPDTHAAIAVTLWAAHTHMIESFYTTPRLALLSPEPASGKTRVLEVLHLLVPGSMFCFSASTAAIFRTLAKGRITLLFDEVDTIFTKRGKDESNEDLRALLNAGYKRGATIPRCVGPQHAVVDFPVYCATALAGLGDLPETIMSRAVIIRMRRRGPDEHVDPFRLREFEHVGHQIRDRLGIWAARVGEHAGQSWPTMPEGIVDRPAEIWEPLISVADAAGGHWPEAARAACIAMCSSPKDAHVSLGIRLLSDLRGIFGDAVALHTETILHRLCNGPEFGLSDDAPWSELYGKPIGVRQLASMLKRYGIESCKVKVDGRALQGYRREHLWDAWQRYLSSSPAEPELPEPSEPTPTSAPDAVPQVPQVPVPRGSERATVTCRDCGFLESDDSCGRFDCPTEPDKPRQCEGFIKAIPLPQRVQP